MNLTSAQWIQAIKLILTFVICLWIVQVINAHYGNALNDYGIFPRRPDGIYGVLIWVFLHGNFQHLLMNTTPLLVLGYFVALRGAIIFLRASIMVTVLGGLGVWIFGRPALHIGASALVFGYFGFLIAMGLYEKSLGALLIAAITLFYYGGMIFGVLPSVSFISWEGHLFGLIAGVIAARILVFNSGTDGTE